MLQEYYSHKANNLFPVARKLALMNGECRNAFRESSAIGRLPVAGNLKAMAAIPKTSA